jgi:hypothetical protein
METKSMDRPNEHDLTWDLVEQNRGCLNVAELNTVFVRLGTGEYYIVIEAILKAVARSGAAVSPQLASRLAVWIEGYDGHPRHEFLCNLVSRHAGDSAPPLTKRTTVGKQHEVLSRTKINAQI